MQGTQLEKGSQQRRFAHRLHLKNALGKGELHDGAMHVSGPTVSVPDQRG